MLLSIPLAQSTNPNTAAKLPMSWKLSSPVLRFRLKDTYEYVRGGTQRANSTTKGYRDKFHWSARFTGNQHCQSVALGFQLVRLTRGIRQDKEAR